VAWRRWPLDRLGSIGLGLTPDQPSLHHADPSHPLALLCTCREWPRDGAAEERYDFASSHGVLSRASLNASGRSRIIAAKAHAESDPNAQVIRFEMASPRPVPPFLRAIELSACWNSWNSLAWSAVEIPGPVSRTATWNDPRLRRRHSNDKNEHSGRGLEWTSGTGHCAAQPMSHMGQNRLLPHCNIGGRFSSISRHTLARSSRAVLRAQPYIIDGEALRMRGVRYPSFERLRVRTPRRKRVSKNAFDLVAGHLQREPPESSPRTCRARPPGGATCTPFAISHCHPSAAKACIGVENGHCQNRLFSMNRPAFFKPISLAFSIAYYRRRSLILKQFSL
jgi:hypothetical protein